MAYRVYSVKIRAEYCDKAKAILNKHDKAGNIDEMCSEHRVEKIDGKNVAVIEYRIRPYIYEDFETIKQEFEQVGIRIM